MLKDNVKKYFQLQQQMEAMKQEMSELKNEIVNDMSDMDVSTFEVDDIKAQVVNKENVKYIDEIAIINTLKKEGLDRFIIEKIDTTRMNKELKTSASLNESLDGLVSKTNAPTLIVKQI